MDVKSLVSQFIKSGSAASLAKQGQQMLNKQKGAKKGPSKGYGLGTKLAGGGVLAALLSSKKARNVGGKALVAGGAIGLGAIAYKAYQNWQSKQAAQGHVQPRLEDETTFLSHTVADDDTVIISAMIAAAKADGHVDPQEKAKIQEAVHQIDATGGLDHFVEAEFNKPLDPAAIARQANNPEVRAQIYLASLLVADDQNFMEKAYLQELSRQLQLEPALVQELESQVVPA